LKKFITLILSIAVIFTSAVKFQISAAGTSAPGKKPTAWSLYRGFTGFHLNSIVSNMKGTNVAVGECGTIMASKNNSSWQTVESNTYEAFNNVLWTGKMFLAFGCNSTLLRSYDGFNWNKEIIPTEGDLSNPSIINNMYFIQYKLFDTETPHIRDHVSSYPVSSSLVVKAGILFSRDGIKWTKIELPELLSNNFDLKKIIYFKKHYIAVVNQSNDNTSGSCILTSSNLSNWMVTRLKESLFDVSANKDNAVIVGSNVIMKTSNSLNWEKIGIPKGKTSNGKFDIRQIITADQKFIILGAYYPHPNDENPPSGELITASSTDAKKWVFKYLNDNKYTQKYGYYGLFDIEDAGCYNFLYINKKYSIIVTDFQHPGALYKYIAESKDGVNWVKLENYKVGLNNTPNCVSWDGKKYICCGDGGNIFISADGSKWVNVTKGINHGTCSDPPSDISYDGSKFTLCNTTGFYSSKDGLNWKWNKFIGDMMPQIIHTDTHSIIHYKNIFITLSDNTILTSSDKKNWSQSYINKSGNINFIKRLGNEFIAVGDNGTILTSKDGLSWQSEVSPITDNFVSAAIGNGKIIIISENYNIIYR
jgi:photosystem II stability/assembly factor-like uncharacterized protein